ERTLHSGDEQRDLRCGAVLALAVIALSAGSAWLIIAVAGRIAQPIGAAAAVLVAWTTLALRGLDDAAQKVGRALEANDEVAARQAQPALVGRDPATLDRAAMIRATVESVAENTSDGVIAPLFFLFAGGPVAAIAYRAINTLDSMIGYRDRYYLFFGRAAARIDDFANYFPARLTALCLIAAAHFVSGRAPQAWTTCREDARKHASPNAGFPEAAVAGALDIQLGGDATYGGEVEHRATLGHDGCEPQIMDIAATRAMMRIATALAFCLLAVARHMIVAVFA
ncbi:MAG TPA: adenosylcobinamide-phosphate synthase CbiB, partial [Candidatus Binataceae bacterium]|nr:adenosylcobinamide-phosphate synthase CbiB [Candidatus Binataceae bacterium]